MSKPFCQSADNNKAPIIEVLKDVFREDCKNVLEIGSGTGQHAAHFAPRLPHLIWHTSDIAKRHAGIHQWLEGIDAANVRLPRTFYVGVDPWPLGKVDGVFTANTAHIMPLVETKLLMTLVTENLTANGHFVQYGPFNVGGEYTSEGNASFDKSLREDGYGGIQNVEDMQRWAPGLTLVDKIPMPANNFCLVWKKRT